jgi:hypothetical protein
VGVKIRKISLVFKEEKKRKKNCMDLGFSPDLTEFAKNSRLNL